MPIPPFLLYNPPIMNGSGVLFICILELVCPLAAGAVFAGLSGLGDAIRRKSGLVFALLFSWVGGQILLWAAFQLLAVPCVLTGRTFEQLRRLSVPVLGAVCVAGAAVGLFRVRKQLSASGADPRPLPGDAEAPSKADAKTVLLWCIFGALLLFQLVMAVLFTYTDGDDAFYVAVATITPEKDPLYLSNPYTGGSTGIWMRYGLAPFPLWIRLLADLSGIVPVTVAHVTLPVALIGMAYAVYALIAAQLLGARREKLPLYLIFTEILVLFGNYSIYSPENFLIARSRQGKAALASLLLPFTFYLLLLLLKRVREKQPIGADLAFLLPLTALAACLCTTLGALLVCMMLGLTAILLLLCERSLRALPLLLLSCVPGGAFALLYLLTK